MHLSVDTTSQRLLNQLNRFLHRHLVKTTLGIEFQTPWPQVIRDMKGTRSNGFSVFQFLLMVLIQNHIDTRLLFVHTSCTHIYLSSLAAFVVRYQNFTFKCYKLVTFWPDLLYVSIRNITRLSTKIQNINKCYCY